MASSHGDNLFARARIDRLNIYAVSELPFTLTHVQLYEGQEIAHPDNIILARNLSSDAAISQSAMTKSSAELVVWCSKSDGVVTVGLGIMDRP